MKFVKLSQDAVKAAKSLVDQVEEKVLDVVKTEVRRRADGIVETIEKTASGERKIFSTDLGNLSAAKAAEYLKEALLAAAPQFKAPTAWVEDIEHMHDHYGFHAAMQKLTPEQLRTYVKFRLDFIREELQETYAAHMDGDPEEIVDGLIDIVVVAIGTLDLFRIDQRKAWDAVLSANMAKRVGVKEGRPNPMGLPDLVKPEGWVGPSHEDNYGLLAKAFYDGL